MLFCSVSPHVKRARELHRKDRGNGGEVPHELTVVISEAHKTARMYFKLIA